MPTWCTTFKYLAICMRVSIYTHALALQTSGPRLWGHFTDLNAEAQSQLPHLPDIPQLGIPSKSESRIFTKRLPLMGLYKCLLLGGSAHACWHSGNICVLGKVPKASFFRGNRGPGKTHREDILRLEQRVGHSLGTIIFQPLSFLSKG